VGDYLSQEESAEDAAARVAVLLAVDPGSTEHILHVEDKYMLPTGSSLKSSVSTSTFDNIKGVKLGPQNVDAEAETEGTLKMPVQTFSLSAAFIVLALSMVAYVLINTN
jgi:hypothetical protein